jgi:ABC-type branched-subunit amino acid transport system ATPase component
MLRVDGLSRMYGGVHALHDVSFAVEPGMICGLIGPNGAGKTTLLNIVSGLQKPSRGRVFLDEQDITGLPAHHIAAAGVARTFQNIRLFGDLPVIDNVLVGRHRHRRDTLFEALFALPGARHAAHENRAIAHTILERLHIASLADVPAASLSYGDQRRVEIARALAQEPRLLLLDEPAAGMNATETDLLAELLLELRASGLMLLVIEHDMDLIMRVSDQVVVLNFGMLIATGTPQQIRRDPEVIAAYLGEDDPIVGVPD